MKSAHTQHMHLMSASHARSLTGCCSSTVNAGFKSISSESLRAYKKIDCSETRGNEEQLQITIAHRRKAGGASVCCTQRVHCTRRVYIGQLSHTLRTSPMTLSPKKLKVYFPAGNALCGPDNVIWYCDVSGMCATGRMSLPSCAYHTDCNNGL